MNPRTETKVTISAVIGTPFGGRLAAGMLIVALTLISVCSVAVAEQRPGPAPVPAFSVPAPVVTSPQVAQVQVRAAQVRAGEQAKRILDATGVKGGFVVHLGCGDGKLTAALRASDSYLVHGLDANAKNVEKAREYITSLGLYGDVSVEQWKAKRLPYNSNVVNLLVAEDLGDLSMDEVLRVLCPNGVAYLKHGGPSPRLALGDAGAGKWKKTVKPRPSDIDEWTHFLYDASNNAVAKDARIATPNHLQWQTGPKRTRDHDAQASISAMTSSNGRIFYILDEGPTSLIHIGAKWKLIARDAFNGKLLWKRDIDSWITHLHYFRTGPAQMPRRLVSLGDRVYVTPGFDSPVTALDAATGKTLLTYKGSKKAEEFICHAPRAPGGDGILLVVVGDPQVWNLHAPVIDNYWDFYDEQGPQPGKHIIAYRADTGKQLWKIEGDNLARLAPLSLVSGNKKVFYLDNEKLYCVDLQSGKQLWDVPFPTQGLFLRNYAPTVVQYKDTVACLSLDRLAVFSIKDGSKLWENKGYAGFASPGDLFIINDVVWTFPGTQAIRVKPADVPGEGKEFLAFDLYTGEVKKSLVKKDVWPTGHHHRCYRNKATERYFISSRRGLEFVDLEGDDNTINWWVRGICQYGLMPCNGLIYAPSHPCQCFNDIKFDGFHALAAESVTTDSESRGRLTKGRAYGQISLKPEPQTLSAAVSQPANLIWAPPMPNADPQEWPTYRHDITRSGCASTKVPADLKTRWQAALGGKLSSVVVAQNKLFVSAVDRQTIHCLDAAKGKQLWKFIAAGPVDSPPTIYGPMALFGCRNGYVYALRVSDGELIWRFRGAPADRRTVVRDRLESLWPIHGSVLVVNGTVYFCAGHTSYLDGGLRLYGLDAATGRLRCSTTLSSAGASQDGTLPDVLISDGHNIIMRQKRFDLSLQTGKAGSRTAPAKAATIMANAGLLEDCWGHRHRWNWTLGAGDTFGKLLVFDEAMAYGVQAYYTFLKHDKSMQPGTHTGHLHQKYARYTPEQFPIGTRLFARENTKQTTQQAGRKPRRTLVANSHKWNKKTLVQFRAMVLADNLLFGAGWKDSVKIFEGPRPAPSQKNPYSENELALTVISTADGRVLKEYPLEAEPVFDGMAAAYGRLYISTKNGKVLCMAEN